MTAPAFFAAMLDFVAAKPAGDDARAAAMMAILGRAAETSRTDGAITVANAELELAARAFAGFAALLQKQILPEAVAHGHTETEAQIRWSVDTAMDLVNTLLKAAAAQTREPVTVKLPAISPH